MMKQLNVGLISHFFTDPNLGCVALSICDVLLIDRAARELGITVKYNVLVSEKTKQVPLDFTGSKYEYRVYSSTKQTLKHPIRLLKTKIFDDCDVVFNINAGDGFTDIYGKWRTFSESYMTLLGAKKGCVMCMAPQTIGPFNNAVCRKLGVHTMGKCKAIFARDHLSYELCRQLGFEDRTTEVIDVALALPFEKKQLQPGFNVGINVSGLLYNKETNRFDLNFDYVKFIDDTVKYCLDNNINVHLISHVNIDGEKGEDDYAACRAVHEKFPDTILVPRFYSPIDAKGYIAGLDLFTGARMHATIASISSGVPVVPIAYSRKVNGLYGNMKYPYYIDARAETTDNKVALDTFIRYLGKTNEMRETIKTSKEIYESRLDEYVNAVKKILSESEK